MVLPTVECMCGRGQVISSGGVVREVENMTIDICFGEVVLALVVVAGGSPVCSQ